MHNYLTWHSMSGDPLTTRTQPIYQCRDFLRSALSAGQIIKTTPARAAELLLRPSMRQQSHIASAGELNGLAPDCRKIEDRGSNCTRFFEVVVQMDRVASCTAYSTQFSSSVRSMDRAQERSGDVGSLHAAVNSRALSHVLHGRAGIFFFLILTQHSPAEHTRIYRCCRRKASTKLLAFSCTYGHITEGGAQRQYHIARHGTTPPRRH